MSVEPDRPYVSKLRALVDGRVDLDTAFDESLHPRDANGEFASGGGGGAPAHGEAAHHPEGLTAWQQPTRANGRPIPIKVKTVEEAVALIHQGKVVEVADVKAAFTTITRLAEMAAEAKAAGTEARTYDLCQVSVAGTNLFCAKSLRTDEYPNGVPRLKMPQMGGHAVEGSDADQLPKNAAGEVNGAEAFVQHLRDIGIRTTTGQVPANTLRASQRELKGEQVGAMMRATSYDPGKEPIFISSDNYVVDGHHRWAAVVGRDAEDGHLGDSTMHVIRIKAPISEVLHLANHWATQFGIAPKAVPHALRAYIRRVLSLRRGGPR